MVNGLVGKKRGLLWLNPPYSNITPWVQKCMQETQHGAEILLLVPASVGANWYEYYVHPWADVYSIGRLKFDNCFDRKTGQLVKTQYPKDLLLCHYRNPLQWGGVMQFWDWKEWV